MPWKADSVDGLKAGDGSTAITGVVTTALATLAVLQQAVKAGANVIVSSQPTFYAKADARTPPARRGPPVETHRRRPPPRTRLHLPIQCSPQKTPSSTSTSWS